MVDPSQPEVTPEPIAVPARAAVVTCPSCSSAYNVETCELVQDTKLREKIADLQRQADGWQTHFQNLKANSEAKIAQLQAQIAAETAPQPAPASQERQFFVA